MQCTCSYQGLRERIRFCQRRVNVLRDEKGLYYRTTTTNNLAVMPGPAGNAVLNEHHGKKLEGYHVVTNYGQQSAIKLLLSDQGVWGRVRMNLFLYGLA
jgi:hypothetical protein